MREIGVVGVGIVRIRGIVLVPAPFNNLFVIFLRIIYLGMILSLIRIKRTNILNNSNCSNKKLNFIKKIKKLFF